MINYTPNEITAIWSAGCGSPGCIFSRLDKFMVPKGDLSLKEDTPFDFERDYKSAVEKLNKIRREKQVRKIHKAVLKDPYHVTFNVPEPGYFECNWCHAPTGLIGLCVDCGLILADLEAQLQYEYGEKEAFKNDPAKGKINEY